MFTWLKNLFSEKKEEVWQGERAYFECVKYWDGTVRHFTREEAELEEKRIDRWYKKSKQIK